MTDELHDRAVEAARYAAASAIRDWIHEQPFSICASSNMDTCPDWPMAYEIRDVALGAALPHLEAAEQGDPLVRVSRVVGFLRAEGRTLRTLRDRQAITGAANAIQRRFAPGPEKCPTCNGRHHIVATANGGGATDGEFSYELPCPDCLAPGPEDGKR